MSGAQGAQPPGSRTATTYRSVEGAENRTKTDIRSMEDVGGIQVNQLQDKVPDAAGKGGPVFGAAAQDQTQPQPPSDNQDLGVSGTG